MKRIEYIDLAKGLCICLVVMFHLAEAMHLTMPFNEYQALFRMPLYYFLSGCFFKAYEGFGGFLRRKVNKLLVPFVFFYVTLSCLYPRLMLDIFGSRHSNLQYSEFLTGFLRDDFPNVPIWFLLALFGMNVLCYGLLMLSQRTRRPSLAFVLSSFILSGLYLQYFGDCGGRYVYAIFRNLPFFAVGYYVFRHTTLLQPNRADRWLPLLIVAAVFCLWFFQVYRLPLRLSLYLCGFAGIYAIIMLAKWIGHLPLISYVGRYSIMLLVTHSLLFHWVLRSIGWISMPYALRFWVALVFILLSYYAIIPFMRRFMPHVTAQQDVPHLRAWLMAALLTVLLAMAGQYAYFELWTPDTYREVRYPTPNIGAGQNAVRGIVLHHTAAVNLESALRTLTDTTAQVSSHVVIDRDGTRYILAEPGQVTWHAGHSALHGRERCNDFMVGIEFQGNTESWPLTQRQLKSAIEYIRPLMARYSIPTENIVTHEMVRSEWMHLHPDSTVATKGDITQREYRRFMRQLTMEN